MHVGRTLQPGRSRKHACHTLYPSRGEISSCTVTLACSLIDLPLISCFRIGESAIVLLFAGFYRGGVYAFNGERFLVIPLPELFNMALMPVMVIVDLVHASLRNLLEDCRVFVIGSLPGRGPMLGRLGEPAFMFGFPDSRAALAGIRRSARCFAN